MISAGASLGEDLRNRLAGELIIAATVHQERFEGVSSRLVASRCSPDFVVMDEASNLSIERGQRGRAELALETFGKAVHSANPDYGINAVMHMVSLLSLMSRNFVPSVHPPPGRWVLPESRVRD